MKHRRVALVRRCVMGVCGNEVATHAGDTDSAEGPPGQRLGRPNQLRPLSAC
ncbi:hypothetical protein ACFPM0_36865 [Pseudonocardia sulfidoxydans]|uniref:hypothetical protein n=1 Tax=Pseudonocardia sulfidoxydans TaxID=54011 RepID=UPI003606A1EB